MTSKFALAALVAALATGSMVETGSVGQDSHRTNAATGIAAGIGSALLGAAIASAKPQALGENRHHGDALQLAGPNVSDGEACFQRPVRPLDPYSGQVFIADAKLICR